MTRAELIEHILKKIGPFPLENDPPYNDEPDYEEDVLAALQVRLPEGVDIKTCGEFRHLGVECCELCHGDYAYYDMSVIELPDGTMAWVCDPIKLAISQS